MTPEGKKVTSLNLAVTLGYGDRKSTQWLKATAWGERLDKLLPYLKKGGLVMVTGSLSCPPKIFTSNGEQKVSALEMSVDIINLLPSEKKEESAPSVQQQGSIQKREPQYASTQNFDEGDLPF
jgi:single-strand DNA-binding protein